MLDLNRKQVKRLLELLLDAEGRDGDDQIETELRRHLRATSGHRQISMTFEPIEGAVVVTMLETSYEKMTPADDEKMLTKAAMILGKEKWEDVKVAKWQRDNELATMHLTVEPVKKLTKKEKEREEMREAFESVEMDEATRAILNSLLQK